MKMLLKKSQFCCLLLKVGLLDIDLCGPSIPYLLNLEDKDGKWSPINMNKSNV